MSELESIRRHQLKQDESLARQSERLAVHEQIIERLAKNEHRMTELIYGVHEQNTSVKLLAREVTGCQNSVEKLTNQVSTLQTWHDNVQGAKSTSTWLVRYGPTLWKLIAAMVVFALIAERYIGTGG
ncbi:hypothetical protein QF117_10515 [Vibrio sp. YMD68]|uniref:hypothetical protein n=1 Tax=Vibrio sp. YMD68 TaxID=3042300 RepID=UPI00249C3253|nr:hypothetical protein [Vibrio sp. YMD68]WGV98851.1 hypothetical protein QF117_02495 [Vibrio sp. YMD68]WGW01222.1 hypothetical protein QF117_10515 [Vibrio sp. YMD68]